VCEHTSHARNQPKVLGAAESSLTYTTHNCKIPDQLIDFVTEDK
jgi:hypothetical protein